MSRTKLVCVVFWHLIFHTDMHEFLVQPTLVRQRGCENKRVYLQDPGDIARARTAVSKLNDFLSGCVRQRSSVNKYTTELVHAAMT